MKKTFSIGFAVLLFGVATIFAQGGGSADPNRIRFAKGKTSAVRRAVLKNDEEMDFVFGARAGQSVTVKISSIPKGRFAAFRVLGDGFDFTTPTDINYIYTFKAPETGDYLVFVKNRPTEKVRRARFVLTLRVE